MTNNVRIIPIVVQAATPLLSGIFPPFCWFLWFYVSKSICYSRTGYFWLILAKKRILKNATLAFLAKVIIIKSLKTKKRLILAK